MQLVTNHIVMARDIGIHGNLFGGILMAWLDEAAAAYATSYCCTPNMVTVRVGELLFLKPLKAGQHVRIYAEVKHMGDTSITLSLKACRVSLYSGEEIKVCATEMTFVRIDDDGSSTPIGYTVKERHRQSREALDHPHLKAALSG